MFLPTLLIAKVVLPIIGPERFGVLLTILSLLAFLSLAEMGVGASLVTSISRALGAGQDARVRSLQTNGFVVVIAAAFILALLALGLSQTDVGSTIFPAGSRAIRREATLGLTVFVVLFALSLPLSLVNKIQLGLQRGHVANRWQIVAAIINFAGGSLAAIVGLGVPGIIIGMMTGTLSCGLANLVTHYRGEPAMRPRRADVDRNTISELILDSGLYLALQVIFTVAYALDTAIVARQLGAEQAAVYGLSERVFSIVAVAVSVVTSPLWAAYGEAFGSSDRDWAWRTLRISTIRIGVAAATLALLLLITIERLISVLSSRSVAVPLGLVAAMAVWRVIEAVGNSLSVFLFANQKVRFILLVGGITAASSFIGKLVLVRVSGPAAIPMVMSACYTALCLIPSLWVVARWDAAARVERTA
jgi:O-antigen/teichoic acid export membrane protein